MRAMDMLNAFREVRALRKSPDAAATVWLEEPQPRRLDADRAAPPWRILEELYERCARHGTRQDIEDLERIRIRRDALADGKVMTDDAVERALTGSRHQTEGVRDMSSEQEREALRRALAEARSRYRSRVRAAFHELIPDEPERSMWERELLATMRHADRPQQLRALVLLTVLAHMYANTSVYSDVSHEKEPPPPVLMRVWKAVARWTKSAAPHQPVGSIYEIAELNVRRVPAAGETPARSFGAYLAELSTILRASVGQRSRTQDAIERVDLLFPFIQRQNDDGSWESDHLERTTWNLIFLMSLVGDHGVRPVFDWLAGQGEFLLGWWERQSTPDPSHPLFASEVREALDAALEQATTWTRVMGSLFSLLNERNAHTPALWFRFVRHWPDWNIETDEQDELVAGFNGGQLQALHALDDLFLWGRTSQLATEMRYQEKYLSDDDHRQLVTLQELMGALRNPWRAFVQHDPETIGRFNAVVWEILSFRVSHTSYAWRVLREGENPSTGGLFEDDKDNRASDERHEALGPDSPQHIHFLNAMVPRLLETTAGLIRDDSPAGRYWQWSLGLGTNGESATDPHRRVAAFVRQVWLQRKAVDEGHSQFRYQSTGEGQVTTMQQQMRADEWLAHLRKYDPRWTAQVHDDVNVSPSTILERALLLRRAEVFSDLDEHLLVEVAPFMREVELDTDEVLFREGEAGEALYIVIDGRLHVERGGVTLAERERMEVVGELAVLDVAARSASVIAMEPTRLLELHGDQLYELMNDRVEIARGIIRVLCRRLRA